MTIITYKQLIDIATGTSEPGIVNFYALHCLLCSFAEQFKCVDKAIDCSRYGNFTALLKRQDGESSCSILDADSKSQPVIVSTNIQLLAGAEYKSSAKTVDIRGETLPAQKQALKAILARQSQTSSIDKNHFVKAPNARKLKVVSSKTLKSFSASSEKDAFTEDFDFDTSSTSTFEAALLRAGVENRSRLPPNRLAAGGDEEATAAEEQPENPPQAAAEEEGAVAEAAEEPAAEGEVAEGETAAAAEAEDAKDNAEIEGEAEPPTEEAEEKDEEPTEQVAEEEPQATAEAEPAAEPEAELEAAPSDEEPLDAEVTAEDDETTSGDEIPEEEPAKEEAPPPPAPSRAATLIERAATLSVGVSDQQIAVMRKTILDMDHRLADIENTLSSPYIDLQKGVGVMKAQIEMAMEQLQTVTMLAMGEEVHVRKLAKLKLLADRLEFMQKQNTFIVSPYDFEEIELKVEEGGGEEGGEEEGGEEEGGEEEGGEEEVEGGEEQGEVGEGGEVGKGLDAGVGEGAAAHEGAGQRPIEDGSDEEDAHHVEDDLDSSAFAGEMQTEKTISEPTISIETKEEEVKQEEEEGELEVEVEEEGEKQEEEPDDEPVPERPIIIYTKAQLSKYMQELRDEYCKMVNKINEIAAAMLEQECMHTLGMIKDLQEQVREICSTQNIFRKAFESIEMQIDKDHKNLEVISAIVYEHEKEKVDRRDLEIILADKVDFKQLQRKASHEEMGELVCRFEKKLCEAFVLLKGHKREVHKHMNDLRDELGAEAIQEVLEKFEVSMRKEIQAVQDGFNEYIRAQQEDCIAAGARSKRIGPLTCISCDSECTMRTTEKCPVPRPCNIYKTPSLGPLIAYQVGTTRKDDVGYMAKEEFPHAPCGWLSRQKVPLKPCAPRHAGGPHTTYTAKDRVTKVLQKPKL